MDRAVKTYLIGGCTITYEMVRSKTYAGSPVQSVNCHGAGCFEIESLSIYEMSYFIYLLCLEELGKTPQRTHMSIRD